MKLILASKSPRRREILKNLGYDFEVITADTNENSDIKNPSELVTELSKRKALAVAEAVKKSFVDSVSSAQNKLSDERIIIACDTVVSTDTEILGKPKDEKDARRMLFELSDNMHSVYSGICLIKGEKQLTGYCKTDVYFDKLTDNDIDWYISQNEWDDKAGAYGIQGKASVFIKKIDGDYFNVVGLPVNLLYNMLKEIL